MDRVLFRGTVAYPGRDFRRFPRTPIMRGRTRHNPGRDRFQKSRSFPSTNRYKKGKGGILIKVKNPITFFLSLLATALAILGVVLDAFDYVSITWISLFALFLCLLVFGYQFVTGFAKDEKKKPEKVS